MILKKGREKYGRVHFIIVRLNIGAFMEIPTQNPFTQLFCAKSSMQLVMPADFQHIVCKHCDKNQQTHFQH